MPVQKSRARVACKLCNLRRVKCDRTAEAACSNCRLAGASCELINSRRGKYTRALNRRSGTAAQPTAIESSPSDPLPALEPEQESAPPGFDTPRHLGNEPLETTTPTPTDRRRYVSPSLSSIAVHKESTNDPGKVVYMGDSANFKYVLHEVGDPFKTANTKQCRFWGDNLQRSMLEKLGRFTQSAIQSLDNAEEHRLRSAGVFQLPSKEVSDELIGSFLRYSSPVFPIFLWEDFMAKYNAGTASLLVLNAVYMVASFHCPESLLRGTGFASRYLAGLTFYRRAKALYDTDYEEDGICIVQATILLSNWWGGPMDQKDTWYWLGAAAGLAQSLGMHRSSSQRVWRRIWWVLYINDIHHAAVYGRPPHIHPSFCDIPPLEEDDLAEFPLAESHSIESKLYLVHLADLISRVGKCLVTKLSSDGSTETNRTSYTHLLEWKDTLPPGFRDLPSQITFETGFWPALIHLYYCDYQIVFYRMLSDTPITVGLSSPLFAAAARISRILEDLVASGTLSSAPFLILPAIFASILVHVTNIRKGDSHVRIVSEHRARLAMHILDTFQDTWAIAIWTRHLLDALLKISTDQQTQQQHHQQQQQQQTGYDNETDDSIFSPTACHASRGGNVPDTQEMRLPDIGGFTAVGGTGLSPPRSTASERNGFSYEGMAENRLAGIPVLFPFTNLLEDAGVSPETCFGPWGSILDG